MTLRWKVNLFSWAVFLVLVSHVTTGPANKTEKDPVRVTKYRLIRNDQS